MQGYDGVENLVYRALARVSPLYYRTILASLTHVSQIMEQVEGGDLVVNKGEESRPKDNDSTREMHAVDGYEAAYKLAQVSIHVHHCLIVINTTLGGTD